MEISLLLIKTIASMFLMMAMGYIIIKVKLITPEQGKVVSTVSLYVVAPCMMISSFQMEYSADRMTGLLFATAAVAVEHAIFISLGTLAKKPLRLTDVEAASIIYPNSVNLIMPIVMNVLGKEWAFYCTASMIVQTSLVWTHGKSLVCGEKNLDWKKIFLNINIISLVIGLALFLLKIKLPFVIADTCDKMGSTLGPLTMLTIGMLLGERGFKAILSDKKAYFVSFLRLIALPLIIVLIAGLTKVENIHPDGHNIMLVVILASSSACAATITQFAQMFDKDAAHAGTVNTMSVLFCIITLPLMVMLYNFLVAL